MIRTSVWKKCDVQTFHDHLNSINEHIQFTIERPTVSEQGESIAFLDTSNTVLKSGQVEVAVYQKATHTEKYLAFDSHHPGQSKAAAVKTLLDRAEAIPSNASKRNVTRRILLVMHVKRNETVKTNYQSQEAIRVFYMLKVFQKG